MKSSSLQRKVECYPPPLIHEMLQQYAQLNEVSKSEAAVLMIRIFFKNLPESEAARYKPQKLN